MASGRFLASATCRTRILAEKPTICAFTATGLLLRYGFSASILCIGHLPDRVAIRWIAFAVFSPRHLF